jgi:ankyrin repeat protein
LGGRDGIFRNRRLTKAIWREIMSINLLIEAVRENYIEVIELILKKIDVNSKDDDGRTPLHWAALYGHTDIVRIFLDNRADPTVTDSDGENPLHLAAIYGHTDIVKELIEAGAELHPTPLGYRY